MSVTGGGGPERVRGDVKLCYSAGEVLKQAVGERPSGRYLKGGA